MYLHILTYLYVKYMYVPACTSNTHRYTDMFAGAQLKCRLRRGVGGTMVLRKKTQIKAGGQQGEGKMRLPGDYLKHQPYSSVNATNSNHVASKTSSEVTEANGAIRSFRGLSSEDFLWITKEIWRKRCTVNCICPNSVLPTQAPPPHLYER